MPDCFSAFQTAVEKLREKSHTASSGLRSDEFGQPYVEMLQQLANCSEVVRLTSELSSALLAKLDRVQMSIDKLITAMAVIRNGTRPASLGTVQEEVLLPEDISKALESIFGDTARLINRADSTLTDQTMNMISAIESNTRIQRDLERAARLAVEHLVCGCLNRQIFGARVADIKRAGKLAVAIGGIVPGVGLFISLFGIYLTASAELGDTEEVRVQGRVAQIKHFNLTCARWCEAMADLNALLSECSRAADTNIEILEARILAISGTR